MRRSVYVQPPQSRPPNYRVRRRKSNVRARFVVMPAMILAVVFLLFLTPLGSSLLVALFPGVPTSPVQPTWAVPSGQVTRSPRPSITPLPEGKYAAVLQVWSATTNFRAVSDPKTDPALTLHYLDQVSYLSGPDANGYLKVRTSDSQTGFVPYQDLIDASLYLYADIPEMTLTSVVPGSKNAPKLSHLVDIHRYAPDITIDLLFAQTKNFTGQILYARNIALLQQGTLDKLRLAQSMFQKSGYSIKIYDAYRPYSVTTFIARFPHATGYLADPKTGSNHNRGAAVDMTIVDKYGNEIEMPTPIHTLNTTSSRSASMSATVRRNLNYVESVMVACGFTPLNLEWWHYNDSEVYKYPYMDINSADIDIVAVLDPPDKTAPPVVDEKVGKAWSITPPANPTTDPLLLVTPTLGPTSDATPTPTIVPGGD